LETRVNRLPQAILTSSQHAAGLLQNQFDVDPTRVHAVPDAVNLSAFTPDCLSEEERATRKTALGIPPERPVVAYLGLLTDYQGTGILLQAAADLRRRGAEVHFLIMGYPAVAHYRQLALDLGLDGWVTFTGKIPYEQAPHYLALGDIAAAPKISDTEGSGKILNYMAMALPTVAFDVPVSHEFLDELGIYAETGNALSLADAIHSLLSDPAQARWLGQRSRQRAADAYSWDQAGLHIVSIYDQLSHSLSEAEPAPDVSALTVPRSTPERQEGERL
jgi:glycosyltransferase involved in cell wall biosynthesis